ncbi:MAG TPA: hypothetical protein VFR90_02835 [Methylibium sp.]|uniref:hypothetical protein n=1 Tax=Methylibium sp. TaxID=2067992 RepID=UPI002DB5BFE2|nr:hypothetical protein [Methylibium sp.]HEU4458039.1 hypothetical protein [Methylibium sp.]
MTPRRCVLAWLAALAAPSFAQPGKRLEDVIEALLAAELPRVIGPAARYTSKVEGAFPDGSQIERVALVGERVARPGNPVLDRFEATLRQVEIDTLRRRVDAIGDAQVEVRLRAGDVAGFLRSQGWVDGAAVGFTGRDGIVVSGRPMMNGYVAPGLGAAEFRGRLLPQGSQLRLAVDAVRIAGFEATEIARAVLEGTINPIVDAQAYAVPARIDDAAVSEGNVMVVRASGSRVVPVAPK